MYPKTIATQKKSYPFRLGTTSFIYPAGWAENVARLAPAVDEVELLFFESRRADSLPNVAEIDRLAAIAAAHDLTYTVHLPVDVDLAAADPADRQLAADTLIASWERTKHLPVTSYTLHLAYPQDDARDNGTVHRWRERARSGLEALLAAGIDPHAISVETLDYPFAWAAPLVAALDLRVCLDIGHLILYGNTDLPGEAVATALDRYLDRTAVVHLHGVAAGRDHRPLDELGEELLTLVLDRLRQTRYAASLSLEIFGLAALERSLSHFEAAWTSLHQHHELLRR